MRAGSDSMGDRSISFSLWRGGLALGLGILAVGVLLFPNRAYALKAALGAWSRPVELGLVAVHTQVLPDGDLLLWSSKSLPTAPNTVIKALDGDPDSMDSSPGLPHSSTLAGVPSQEITEEMVYHPEAAPPSEAQGSRLSRWDPVTRTFNGTIIQSSTTNLFCSGHTFLPNGNLLIAGGHLGAALGSAHTHLFNWRTNGLKELPLMNEGRWYPSVITLADGGALVLGGTNEQGELNPIPQVWQPDGTWRDLTTALPQGYRRYYPWIFLAPNGKVFYAGPRGDSRYLDTRGTGSWGAPWPTQFGDRGSYGTAVMYRPGQVLMVGGNDPPTARAEVIDLNQAQPQWREVAPMLVPRRQLNATLLADGRVLVTGGTSGSGFNNPDGAVLAAELWDPDTEQWTALASMKTPRLYHSTAALLPDGRVFVAGGGEWKQGVSYPNAVFFSPPYLFRGARPVIARAPAQVTYNQSYFLQTPDDIRRVTLVRLSSVTHGFNSNQRFNSLTFTPTSGGIRFTTPSNPNLAPPGHYWLFVLTRNGIPSLGQRIQLLP